jgi:hypothetical protein
LLLVLGESRRGHQSNTELQPEVTT